MNDSPQYKKLHFSPFYHSNIFKEIRLNKLIHEGLGKIYTKFDSVDAIGPNWLVRFLDIVDEEEIDRIKRDAFERINTLMEKIGVKKFK